MNEAIFMRDPEFQIPDYDSVIKQVKKLIAVCREKIRANKNEAIHDFNQIFERELDAILDNLVVINHFHASARCLRAALELVAKNICISGGYGEKTGLCELSFADKYKVRKLTWKNESPLLNFVRAEIISEELFSNFRETYGNLSKYVHYRITYELAHTRPDLIKNEQWYAKAAWLVSQKGRNGRDVKATMIEYTLVPALEVLNDLLDVCRNGPYYL
jgi:hypothetical protein